MKTFLIGTLAFIINAIASYIITLNISEDSMPFKSLFFGLVAVYVCTIVGVSVGLLMGKIGKVKS